MSEWIAQNGLTSAVVAFLLTREIRAIMQQRKGSNGLNATLTQLASSMADLAKSMQSHSVESEQKHGAIIGRIKDSGNEVVTAMTAQHQHTDEKLTRIETRIGTNQ